MRVFFEFNKCAKVQKEIFGTCIQNLFTGVIIDKEELKSICNSKKCSLKVGCYKNLENLQ